MKIAKIILGAMVVFFSFNTANLVRKTKVVKTVKAVKIAVFDYFKRLYLPGWTHSARRRPVVTREMLTIILAVPVPVILTVLTPGSAAPPSHLHTYH